MKKFQNTNIKVISKVSEYANCDAVDIAYDAIDYSRAESVKNGVQISRQSGKRRLIDNARNKYAHEQVDYSTFKVTKIEAGQTIDISKKEQDIESAALDLLAELGINWADDTEQEQDDNSEQEQEQITETEQPEMEETQTVSIDVESAIKAVKKARTISDIRNLECVEAFYDKKDDDKYFVYFKSGFSVDNTCVVFGDTIKEVIKELKKIKYSEMYFVTYQGEFGIINDTFYGNYKEVLVNYPDAITIDKIH